MIYLIISEWFRDFGNIDGLFVGLLVAGCGLVELVLVFEDVDDRNKINIMSW